MNKFIYLFAILGSLALATAQIAEPDVSNTAADDAQEPGILTPFEDSLPVDGDSDYFKNGEDYGGIYEGYFEDAEGFVSTADDVNDDLGYTEEPIVSEEFAGLVDVPEPLNEEDATIGEAVVEPSEDPFQFNHIPNSALDSDVGEDFYGSWEAIADSPDDIISEEGFVSLPDALIQFEEEAAVDVSEALVGLEEAKTADIQSGEADYPDDLTEAEEDNFSEAFVDYPDNLVESGEVVSEALVDYPDDLVESEEEEDSSQGIVDYPDDLFESEEVTVDIPEAYVGEPEDITDAGEADEPEDITDAGEADEPEDITDAGEVGEPEDITDAGEADEPEDITDAGEVDEPEDPKEDDAVVELDPRVLDTNEEESPVQGYAVQLDNVEQAEEKSKNFLG